MEKIKRHILSKEEKVKKFGEVFTPDWLVSNMCDMLEQQSPGAFDIDKTFLEPTCGDGVFVCEILRRKFQKCKTKSDYLTALKSVYAMEIQADNVEKTIQNVTELCEKHFKLSKRDLEIVSDHVIQADSLKVMKMIIDINEREMLAREVQASDR